ncbi:hypothetical protein [Pseudolysinimonas sp.]|uniref:hypothetical protein n=1 Tax=Pseudolysinimonas sp. TaxID=2680009 RepID=UPI00326553DE
MTPRWVPSSEKHGVPREDQIHAILHATYSAVTHDEGDGGTVVIYIGPAHSQTERELEVLVNIRPGLEAVIFHAMQLGPHFRTYREEHPVG